MIIGSVDKTAETQAQLIFTLSYRNVMIISPSDSSRRRNIMSKYIPDNQKIPVAFCSLIH